MAPNNRVKGKAPERQPTVSPNPEESGPSEQLAIATPGREIAIQTPQRLDNEAFSKYQLDTINSIVNLSISRSIREDLLPSLQEIITNQLQVQLSQSESRFQTASPTPAPEPPAIEPPTVEQPPLAYR
jgi:hypothetical protein